jgi:methionyl-tRNA formyltransferase
MTNKLPHAEVLLRHIQAAHIPIDTILLESPSPASFWKQIKGYQKKLGWPDTLRMVADMGYTRYVRYAHLVSPTFYQPYARQVISLPHFNQDECYQCLLELQPDVIVLGGSRILKARILQTARLAVLNAHPGVLPKYRGVDSSAWAIHHGDPVGSTVHVVDPGVDTGPIIARQIMPIPPGVGLAELDRQLTELCGELMVQALQGILQTGSVQALPQLPESGQQFYKMPRRLFNQIDRQLKQGNIPT